MFSPAIKSKQKFRLLLEGTAGSGKTYSALNLASHICGIEGGAVACIDTEHGRASKYGSGKPFTFDTVQLKTFAPADYINAIRAAAKAGYTAIVIDSLSQNWTGKGGCLEMAEGKFNNWKTVTPEHNALIEAILSAPAHVIATVRCKTEYAIEINERGKPEPKKVGVGIIQRDNLDYEFDMVGRMQRDTHVIEVLKKPFPGFSATVVAPDHQPRLVQVLLDWLNDGAEPAPQAVPDKETPAPVAAGKPTIKPPM